MSDFDQPSTSQIAINLRRLPPISGMGVSAVNVTLLRSNAVRQSPQISIEAVVNRFLHSQSPFYAVERLTSASVVKEFGTQSHRA